MRHKKQGRKFGRVRNQRKALLKGLTRSLIQHERIETTVPRAKETRRIVEKLVTSAKKETLASRREIARVLGRDLTKKLFSDVSPRYKDRPGGYTRIIRTRRRIADWAEMAILEFVE